MKFLRNIQAKYGIAADGKQKKFLGKTARDVPFVEYATKDSPFALYINKLGEYGVNIHVYQAFKRKDSYKAMQKVVSKAWNFHGKQSSTLHMIQALRLGNLLMTLYASHPDAPPDSREAATKWAHDQPKVKD